RRHPARQTRRRLPAPLWLRDGDAALSRLTQQARVPVDDLASWGRVPLAYHLPVRNSAMNGRGHRALLALLIVSSGVAARLPAQTSDYLNLALPLGRRVDDLLSRMTLGAGPGDLRRRPVSHGPARGAVHQGHAGRRPEIPEDRGHGEALRRAFGSGARASYVRRRRE